ncbi:hypothetical protein MJO28_014509 [Puccinia striiformis f. sp. tritici]|uniref:Uncharacterized protein n=1 Tax=Puccinia striiformis f. sp. tritici TaxID=168172 RepID=A0ACC0DTQ0_9BASI|nr:hypothetical protein MJO28_014509 [Puccinia striiformis f. sp. tritici]
MHAVSHPSNQLVKQLRSLHPKNRKVQAEICRRSDYKGCCPEFSAEPTNCPMADSRAILFSHPANFTAVCTTEMGEWLGASQFLLVAEHDASRLRDLQVITKILQDLCLGNVSSDLPP